MKPEIKDAWVKELRSGKYKQARLALGLVNDLGEKSFCCLGVLCEMAVEAGVIEKPTLAGDTLVYNNESTLLPERVMEWAGLDNDKGGAPFEGGVWAGGHYLSEVNDEVDSSFKDIAYLIESSEVR